MDIKKLVKLTENDYAAVLGDDDTDFEVNRYIDTGSYSFNALLSGSIYGGLAGNKVLALAGEPSTGKTFYAIAIAKRFLEENPEGFIVCFESESAITKQMIVDRKIDVDQFAIIPVITIQEFRTQAMKIINAYLEEPESERKPMLFILDSLGNLSTEKEISDIADGKDTRDMTRAQLIKGAFRSLTLKLGRAKIPMIVTNHVYDVIGAFFPIQKMSGGSGIQYSASQVVFLSKKKDKDADNEVTGVIITGTLKKSRITIENKKAETLLNYQTGLDRYYGLIDLAVKFGIFKKLSKQIELPDGTKKFENAIIKNPEKYFTKEILDQIDEFCKGEFLYGNTNVTNDEGEK
ncbi:MAG: recombinase RecA [Candidatus Paceibacterota bacterium]